MVDLDRLTKREAYAAGVAEGRAASRSPAESSKPGYQTSEFWLTLMTTIFSMWVGYRLVVNPELDLERGGAVIAAVLGAAWFYTTKRSEVKKAEAGNS